MSFVTRIKPAIALAATLVAAAAAQAAPLSNVAITGVATGYCLAGTTVSACLASTSLVTDGAAAGNIQLGLLGSTPASTLSGEAGGHSFLLSSLTQADWTQTLAKSYITAAAGSVGLSLPDAVLTSYANAFIGGNSWRAVSDPNVSYVDYTGSTLSIGLAGVYDARPLFTALFGAVIGTVPGNVLLQASEVVKVSVDGGAAQYLFGFVGAATGFDNGSTTSGYSANYVVSTQVAEVSEPASIALLGLGLVGLVAAKRRRKA